MRRRIRLTGRKQIGMIPVESAATQTFVPIEGHLGLAVVFLRQIEQANQVHGR